MNRRPFLKITAAGLLMLGGYPFLNSCANKIRKTASLNYDSSLSGINAEHLKILYFASLAPSSHNTQPWRVKIAEPGTWLIGLDQSRLLTAVDPDSREALLSLGTFCENLTIAANACGFSASLEFISQDTSDAYFLQVKLKRDRVNKFPLEELQLRRTLRKNFLNKELSSSDLNGLVAGNPDDFLYFPAQSAQGKMLADATLSANISQVGRETAQQELADWIHWDDDAVNKNRDGLTPDTMEISGIGGWVVRHFYNRDSVLKQAFRDQTIDMVENQLSSYAGWLIISSPDSDPESLIECGRKYQRLLLKIRALNIAAHPMSQVLEETPFDKQIKTSLAITNNIQFAVRLGYVENYPKPVSPRRPPEWFIS